MDIEKRKALRMDILKRCYDRNFDPSQKEGKLKHPKHEDAELSNYEVFKAYSYLSDKGLILFSSDSFAYTADITAKGIDCIEDYYTGSLSPDEMQRKTNATNEYNEEIGKMFE